MDTEHTVFPADLVRAALEPSSTEREVIALDPAVELSLATEQVPVSLILHEVATNP